MVVFFRIIWDQSLWECLDCSFHFPFHIPLYPFYLLHWVAARCLSFFQDLQLTLIVFVDTPNFLLCLSFGLLKFADCTASHFQLVLEPSQICFLWFQYFKLGFVVFRQSLDFRIFRWNQCQPFLFQSFYLFFEGFLESSIF